MRRYSKVVLAWGLLLGLLSGCQDMGNQGGPDLRVPPDLRTSNGNPALGAACGQDVMCPPDPITMKTARCAVIMFADAVGACTPSCDPGKVTADPKAPCGKRYADCDTVLPGCGVCTQMTGNGTNECVLFCDEKKVIGGRDCPQGWNCVVEPQSGFKICQPPQNLTNPDMPAPPPPDMAVPPHDMH